ncbi:hypothetical protein [Sphingomonas sp. BE137]|uniref:hypothetical protein n=1 Tax=Sphingomonas sp. BE137 TaxID=2817844 RepID=UPI001AE33FF1|nr:hypothetical protein [Sphingomonas sp. BE137]MDR6850357.1 hypothetical protein [Sphingomonas sp. BE137]
MLRVPRRTEMRAVLIVADGMGWRVGIGDVVTGSIEGTGTAHMSARDAETAATALADMHDLIALQS